MVTIFSTPKAYRGHIKIIQMNAIQSWLRLCPPCEIILFGKEEGTAEVAAQYNIQHIPEVECSEFGTPLVNALFRKAEFVATNDVMCYLNGDIILMSDFIEALKNIRYLKNNFLVVGQRCDLPINELWDFKKKGWEISLSAFKTQNGTLSSPRSIDYFVFPKGQWADIPPFVVGRAGWDDWLFTYAYISNICLIDATGALTAIHQTHDYSHHPGGRKAIYQDGIEVRHNFMFIKAKEFLLDIGYAPWVISKKKLRLKRPWENLFNQIAIGRNEVRSDPPVQSDTVYYFFIPRFLFRILVQEMLNWFKYLFIDQIKALYYRITLVRTLGKMYEHFRMHNSYKKRKGNN